MERRVTSSIRPPLFPDSAEAGGGVGIKYFSRVKAKKHWRNFSVCQRLAGPTGASGSIPSPPHPTKTTPEAQSIRFPFLSSHLSESWWTNLRDRPSILPHQHGGRGGDRCLFSFLAIRLLHCRQITACRLILFSFLLNGEFIQLRHQFGSGSSCSDVAGDDLFVRQFLPYSSAFVSLSGLSVAPSNETPANAPRERE